MATIQYDPLFDAMFALATYGLLDEHSTKRAFIHAGILVVNIATSACTRGSLSPCCCYCCCSFVTTAWSIMSRASKQAPPISGLAFQAARPLGPIASHHCESEGTLRLLHSTHTSRIPIFRKSSFLFCQSVLRYFWDGINLLEGERKKESGIRAWVIIHFVDF